MHAPYFIHNGLLQVNAVGDDSIWACNIYTAGWIRKRENQEYPIWNLTVCLYYNFCVLLLHLQVTFSFVQRWGQRKGFYWWQQVQFNFLWH